MLQHSSWENTPKPLLVTGSTYRDHAIPTRFGSEGPSRLLRQLKPEPSTEEDDKQQLAATRSPAEQSIIEFDPIAASTPAQPSRVTFHTTPVVTETSCNPSTAETQAAEQPATSPPTVRNSVPLQSIPLGAEGLCWTLAPEQETKEQEEVCTMNNIANVLTHALTCPLEQAVHAATQTPAPQQPKSKIPALEKYSGKKGNAAKSFILDCKTYFVANLSSFPTDNSRIMYVLMNLKEGIPKQWGQYYLNKLLGGDQDPLLNSWEAFETGFLANWSDCHDLLSSHNKTRESIYYE
jgi:hypothetical protein